MSGKRQNQHSFERKRAKQARKRPRHIDKYAKDRQLANPNGEEADHE